jgi:hypothetical protein
MVIKEYNNYDSFCMTISLHLFRQVSTGKNSVIAAPIKKIFMLIIFVSQPKEVVPPLNARISMEIKWETNIIHKKWFGH